jgi:hypothetical protein
MRFVLRVLALIATNVWQAKVGGLSKPHLSQPTKGYFEDTCLLVSRKLKFALATLLIVRRDDPIPPNCQ